MQDQLDESWTIRHSIKGDEELAIFKKIRVYYVISKVKVCTYRVTLVNNLGPLMYTQKYRSLRQLFM